MQNRSPATDKCISRWYFKFPTDFYEKCTKIIVVPSTIPSSRFYFQPQHPMTRNRPISERTSGMVRSSIACLLIAGSLGESPLLLEPYAPPIVWSRNRYAGLCSDTHIRCRDHLSPLLGPFIMHHPTLNVHTYYTS